MQGKFILRKDHMLPLLRKLRKEYRFIAPVQNRHGDTLFAEIDRGENISPDLSNQPQNSVKQFFLPQQEEIFHYSSHGDAYAFVPQLPPEEPSLYFGVRPCDLSALLYMDVIFLQRSPDPFFQARRKNSVVIGLNCNKPFDNCFCNAGNTGPFIDYGFDLQLTDLGDRFLVEHDRARGEQLIRRWQQFFTEADEDDIKARYQTFLEARGAFRLQVHMDLAVKKLVEGKVADSVWNELSERCQDCGGCSYICPTCTCFTMYDQKQSETEGFRVRSWDACTFSGFTRMAGDHNPVNSLTHAIEHRFRHKLQYDVKKHGRSSCVGCGRCVGICFGGTDIVRFIDMACDGV